MNPIPLNPTPGSKWTASRRHDEQEFVRRLNARGIAATIRDTRGREIDGACGQLEPGLAGAGVPVQPAGGFFKLAHDFFSLRNCNKWSASVRQSALRAKPTEAR